MSCAAAASENDAELKNTTTVSIETFSISNILFVVEYDIGGAR